MKDKERTLAKHAFYKWREKVILPALFDDCMAFFTGYKKTAVTVKSKGEFIKLVRQCAEYCALRNDFDSLQLLIYAVNRRIFHFKPVLGSKRMVLTKKLTSAIYNDKLRGSNPKIHLTNVMSSFSNFLSLIEEKYTHLIPLNALLDEKHRLALEHMDNDDSDDDSDDEDAVALWYQKFKVTLSSETSYIEFTRGGGLYNMIDLLKGFNNHQPDDSQKLSGIYVSPAYEMTEGKGKGISKGNRDDYYAKNHASSFFFDVKSVQKGLVHKNSLMSSNNNAYEAVIESRAVPSCQSMKIALV